MWIFLNDAFISVVQHPKDKTLLIARARVAGDLERVFDISPSSCLVQKTPRRDYLYRCVVSREELAEALASQARAIDYTNFKDSVEEDARHDAYLSVWQAMSQYQRDMNIKPRPRSSMFNDDVPLGGK